MSLVLQELKGRVAVLTLNRPEARNALSPELLTELEVALALADADPATTVMVLTGAGEKAFCSGADLGKSFGNDGGFMATHNGRFVIAQLFKRFHALKKPIIGAANGAALAGGLGVIMACDLIVAADRATFGLPEVKRGLMPFMVMAVLERQLGHKRALELVLTGEAISAQRAADIGLINLVVPNDGFIDHVVAYADKIAGYSTMALSMGKAAFYRQADLGFDAALDYLHSQLTLNTLTEDAAEGISAFFEKRPAAWKGR